MPSNRPPGDLPHFGPGRGFSAAEMNRLVEELRRAMNLAGEHPIEVRATGTGYLIRLGDAAPLEQFPAKITAVSGGLYSWTMQSVTAAGLYTDHPNNRTGSPTWGPARERNGATATTFPFYALLTRRTADSAGTGPIYDFDIPAAALAGTSINVLTNDCHLLDSSGNAVHRVEYTTVTVLSVGASFCVDDPQDCCPSTITSECCGDVELPAEVCATFTGGPFDGLTVNCYNPAGVCSFVSDTPYVYRSELITVGEDEYRFWIGCDGENFFFDVTDPDCATDDFAIGDLTTDSCDPLVLSGEVGGYNDPAFIGMSVSIVGGPCDSGPITNDCCDGGVPANLYLSGDNGDYAYLTYSSDTNSWQGTNVADPDIAFTLDCSAAGSWVLSYGLGGGTGYAPDVPPSTCDPFLLQFTFPGPIVYTIVPA